jgi:glycosidase
MRKRNQNYLLVFLSILVLLFGCSLQGPSGLKNPGKISFSIGQGLSRAAMPENNLQNGPAEPKFILVSIKNPANGAMMYTREKVELFNNNGEYLSTSIPLRAGSYQLTEFIVTDDADNIIYVTPLAGSQYDYLVTRPLPIEFSISADNTTVVRPEVVSVTGPLSAYGYAAFTFEIKDNLLKNGDFTTGTSDWILWTNDGAQASMVSENAELKITVANPGPNLWSIGLKQHGFPIQYGETYTVSFRARSDTLPGIKSIVQLDGSPWTLYSGGDSFTLSPVMSEYTYTFTMRCGTDNAADFEFFIGGQGNGAIYIDNIILKKISMGAAEAEINFPVVTPNVDRSNIILYEISPGSYNGGSWDGGQCLKGITARLDLIKRLGINCIWINPVLEGEGMGYWTCDYYKISNKLGTLNDMKELVYEAHKRDMLVIIDLVINHTWIVHPFFQDVVAQGSASPYADWYLWDGEPGASNFDKPNNEQTLANVNFNNPQAKEYMFTVAEYWVNKLDIDGYRVDVAMLLENRHPGISAELINRLKAVKPNIFMLAEGYVNEERFFNNGYNSAYDWDFRGWEWSTTTRNALNNVFTGTMTLQEMHTILARSIAGDGLPLRFAENHDMSRAAAMWGIGGSKAAHTVVMTSRGYAMVYGGGEVGFAPPADIQWSQSNPIVWDYSCPLYDYFPKIIAIRKQYLKSNLLQSWIPNDNTAIYSSLSVSGTNKLITVANFTGASVTMTLALTIPELGIIGGLRNLITDVNVPYAGNGSLTLTLGGYDTAILLIQ